MKKILFASAFVCLLFSCEKKNNQEAILQPDFDSSSVVKESDTLAQKPITTHCFTGTSGKDSLFLSYEDNLGTIIGKLSYKNVEKDNSKGEIAGLMDGDTLKVTYTFDGEGTTSDREIWFLRKNQNLIEGIGKYDAEGVHYSDTKNIKFDESYVLKPSDCDGIEKKLK